MYWRQSTYNHTPLYGQYGGYQTNTPKKYPEDIQCVHPSSHPKKGAIYVSNVEAAENPNTLKSNQYF